MKNPPKLIDDAQVLYWAWSGEKPFGIIPVAGNEDSIEVYGLAICKYERSNKIYRFSCNKYWESEQDSDYISIKEAIDEIPNQYRNVPIIWNKVD